MLLEVTSSVVVFLGLISSNTAWLSNSYNRQSGTAYTPNLSGSPTNSYQPLVAGQPNNAYQRSALGYPHHQPVVGLPAGTPNLGQPTRSWNEYTGSSRPGYSGNSYYPNTGQPVNPYNPQTRNPYNRQTTNPYNRLLRQPTNPYNRHRSSSVGNCPNLISGPSVSGGVRPIPGNPYSATATYRCNDPHAEHVSGSYSLQCTNGVWNGEPLVCESPSACPELQSDEHTHVQVQPGRYAHTAWAFYRCMPGFNLISGAERRECNRGEWRGEPMVCGEMEPGQVCSDPPSPSRSTIVSVTGVDTPIASVFYRCTNPQFPYYLSGQERVVCTNGVWNGRPLDCQGPTQHQNRYQGLTRQQNRYY